MSDWTPADVTAANIDHYERHAEAYLDTTLEHAMDEAYAAFEQALPQPPPARLLDFGCGVGRDLRHFCQAGHKAVGLDGSRRCARIARKLSGCPVWVQDFAALSLPQARFDGVFANASLFHLPSALLPKVLGDLARTLRPHGVLFTNNPRGEGQEGWAEDRYVTLLGFRAWSALLAGAGLRRVAHFYRPPGLPRAQQGWLAMLWRKP
jgi:SAM-dependent methyltransferase